MSYGLIIAAPTSGSGKTVFTLGLIRAWKRQGRQSAAAKIGPDYIDPGFHRAAGAGALRNLDHWAMRTATIASAIRDLADAGDYILCEGVMGLFDGAQTTRIPNTGNAEINRAASLGQCCDNAPTPAKTVIPGSTADCAVATGWPVLLIIDAAHQAASVGAVIHGCATACERVTISGVVFNRVGSPGHREALETGLRLYAPGIPLLGFLPRHPSVDLPGRYLGLVQAGELTAIEEQIENIADWVSDHCDLAALDQIIRSNQGPTVAPPSRSVKPPIPPLGQRMAIARDRAFSFLYDGIVEGWRKEGAEICFFSPLDNTPPANDADAVILPGGYPELYAGTLASNQIFLSGLHQAADRGATLYGECGGFMTLGKSITDRDGHRHIMAGLLPLESDLHKPTRVLGYRHLTLAATTALGKKGEQFRGHEFRYSRITTQGKRDGALFMASDAAGRPLPPMGLRHRRVLGSFAHIIDRHETDPTY